MKTKNKIIVLLEIAIVLCSVFLMALPAITADQNTQEVSACTVTTASEDDYVLGIYGNANEDNTIDMRDLTYVKLIFFGKKPETELADAKYDGKINPLDFIQIKLIIVGKEKEITILDAHDKTMTIYKPVKRMIVLHASDANAVRALRAENIVVGVSTRVADEKILLPTMSKLPVVGSAKSPDCEKIIELSPDIVLAWIRYPSKQVEEKLKPAGINVIRIDVYNPGNVTKEFRKLGYILGKKEESEEFISWYEGYMDMVKSRTERLSEEQKPRVYLDMYPAHYKHETYCTRGGGSGHDTLCKIVGGINVASELPYNPTIDPEWIISQNPDIILQIVCDWAIPAGYRVDDDISGMRAVREDILSKPEFQRITAIKNGDVYVIASDIEFEIQTVIGVAYLAKWFNPALFEDLDLDPHEIHKEYIDRFQRIDYDIDEHGVFVYHPVEHPDGR